MLRRTRAPGCEPGRPAGVRVRRAECRGRMIVLGIDPGLASTGYGVVRAPRRAPRRARRRRHRDAAAHSPPSGAWPPSTRASPSCWPSTRPDAVALEDLYFGRTCAPRSRSGRRAASCCWPPAQARRALRRLHAPAGQGRGLRHRARGQGPGQPHGPGAARRCPSRRGPTTPPTRWPSPSATPTTRRCAARASAGAGDDRARRRRGRRPPPRPRRARDRRRRRLPRWPSRPRRCARSRPSGSRLSLHSHLIVRDDALQLYGFATEEERDLFLLLIGVQAVGPKVALARPLRRRRRASWSRALAAGDVARFQAVPGHRQARRPSGSSSSCARRSSRRSATRTPTPSRCTDAAPSTPTTRARLARDGLRRARLRPARGRGACSAAAAGDSARGADRQRPARPARR